VSWNSYGTFRFSTDTTSCSLQKSHLSYKDILVELPLTIHNSHLLTSFLHQLPSKPTEEEWALPTNLAALSKSNVNTPQLPLAPNLDSLDLSIDPFLEKTCDLLLDSIESHYTELNNHQYYQRQLAREQAKITAWQTKRKSENAARVASKQTPLPEDEWTQLYKLPQEPSRLEGLLNSRQVEQYARQVDGFSANVTSKMFAVKSNMIPNRGDSQ
jgi:translation initiation factor 3 subunit H